MTTKFTPDCDLIGTNVVTPVFYQKRKTLVNTRVFFVFDMVEVRGVETKEKVDIVGNIAKRLEI